MDQKGRTSGRYEVEVSYYGLTVDELYAILKLYHDGKLYFDMYLGHPVIECDYDTDWEGWEEPNGMWTIKLPISNCGGIDEDSFNKWYEDDIIRQYKNAEEIRRLIKEETGIE